MQPILLNISGIPIYAYGFFMAMGYLSALALLIKLGKPYGISLYRAVDLSFYSLLFGLVGARITFMIIHPEIFREDPIRIFSFWSGGLVFYGGFLAAALFAWLFSRSKKIPLLPLLDLGAVCICLAHAIGRIGCFMAGCCHGNACEYPWAVTLSSDLVATSLRNTPIHPVQLYESFTLFLLFIFLLLRLKKNTRNKKAAGEVALLYVAAYAIIRFVLEFFRGDTMRGYWLDSQISTSQGLAILLLSVCAFLWWRLFYRASARR